MTTLRTARVSVALAAAGLVLLSARLPLWTMEMEAPQYPKGLHLYAYGTEMRGDLRELDILNHYIGMPPISAPALETAMFPIAIAALVVLSLLSPLHGWLRRIAIAGTASAPLAILIDLQWRLYEFGHSLNPKAPIRLKPFTPLVIGETEMGNFESHAMVSWGFACLVLAAVLLMVPGLLARRMKRPPASSRAARVAVAAIVFIGLFTDVGRSSRAGVAGSPRDAGRSFLDGETLQEILDAAPRGGTIVVPAGVYAGPIVIRGPLTVIGEPGAIVDGGGSGSVVTIEGSDVVFRGFGVRNSGRNVTEEAAGIKAAGSGHRIEANRVHDVYFGIHVGGGARLIVGNNVITPGTAYGARPGHGISAWHVTDSEIAGNRVASARDGIYLSFTERVVVSGNTVSGCRYGLHSMYSQEARFERNDVTANLLGAALMMSDRLVLRGNRIGRHRDGTAAYGVLLKDIGDLVAEDNEVIANRIGIYAEGVPTRPSSEALFVRNVIAGNEVGLALQSTAALTFTENRMDDNLTDVRALGRQLSPGMRWSRDGRGNAWGQYRGFDSNRDGIGDVPYRLDDAMDALVRKNAAIQAFLYTPAHRAIEAAARMFPAFRQPPVLVDEFPLMSGLGGGTR